MQTQQKRTTRQERRLKNKKVVSLNEYREDKEIQELADKVEEESIHARMNREDEEMAEKLFKIGITLFIIFIVFIAVLLYSIR